MEFITNTEAEIFWYQVFLGTGVASKSKDLNSSSVQISSNGVESKSSDLDNGRGVQI
jgi:hypothetical protein